MVSLAAVLAAFAAPLRLEIAIALRPEISRPALSCPNFALDGINLCSYFVPVSGCLGEPDYESHMTALAARPRVRMVGSCTRTF